MRPAETFGKIVCADVSDYSAALVAVFSGAYAGVGFEFLGKPALVFKATAGGNFAEGHVRVQQQVACFFHP